MKGLKKLDLSYNKIKISGLLHLVNSPYLAGLEILLLNNALVRDEVKYIEYYPSYLRSLKVLSLANNNLHNKLNYFVEMGMFSHSASE